MNIPFEVQMTHCFLEKSFGVTDSIEEEQEGLDGGFIIGYVYGTLLGVEFGAVDGVKERCF